jgi:predicted Zn-dependent peptidase
MAKNEFIFGRYVDSEEIVSQLEKVTADEVIDVASDIFRDGKVSLTMLGPFREEDLDRSNLQL